MQAYEWNGKRYFRISTGDQQTCFECSFGKTRPDTGCPRDRWCNFGVLSQLGCTDYGLAKEEFIFVEDTLEYRVQFIVNKAGAQG